MRRRVHQIPARLAITVPTAATVTPIATSRTNPCATGKMCNPDGQCRGPQRVQRDRVQRRRLRQAGQARDDDLGDGLRAERNVAAVRHQRVCPDDRRSSADGRRRLQSLRRRPCRERRSRPCSRTRAATSPSPNVPSGHDIPLVITSGKWRRQITIPMVNSCADNMLAAADTRLPKTQERRGYPEDRDHDRQRRLARVPDPQDRRRR